MNEIEKVKAILESEDEDKYEKVLELLLQMLQDIKEKIDRIN